MSTTKHTQPSLVELWRVNSIREKGRGIVSRPFATAHSSTQRSQRRANAIAAQILANGENQAAFVTLAGAGGNN